jgi:hypothetical protein
MLRIYSRRCVNEVKMCVVGEPCAAHWKENLKDGCPPPTAKNVTGETYYRLLENVPPEDVDFQSHLERNIPTSAPECEARSVSLMTSQAAAQARLLPRADRWKGIGAVSLPNGSGAIFVKRTHVHWWPCGAWNFKVNCAVVE